VKAGGVTRARGAARFGSPEPARGLRLTRPLGAEAGLDQLVIELRPAAVASDFCRRGRGSRSASVRVATLLVLLALVAALLLALLHR